jgi:protein TonB
MFESTLEAQALNESERRFGTLSAAALAHVAFGAAIVAATAFIVPPVHTPEPPHMVIISPGIPKADPTPPSAPTAPPKNGADEARRDAVVPPPRVTPELPPAKVPDLPLLPPADSAFPGPPRDGEGTSGDPNGSGSGIPGGAGDDPAGGGGGGTVGPVYVTGEMVRPVRLVKGEPEYPRAARQAGLGGRVTLRAVIAEDGSVEAVEVLSSSNSLFDSSAVDAVRKWRYRPALMNGRPVRVYFSVVVNFVVR